MYQITKRHIPKYRSRYTRRYENLKSHVTEIQTSMKDGKFIDQLSLEWALKEQCVHVGMSIHTAAIDRMAIPMRFSAHVNILNRIQFRGPQMHDLHESIN
jgi:hypothetical protein